MSAPLPLAKEAAAEPSGVFLARPEPFQALAGWEIGALLMARERRLLWRLALIGFLVVFLNGLTHRLPGFTREGELLRGLWFCFALFVVAWPPLAVRTAEELRAGLGLWPPSLRHALPWIDLLGVAYSHLWLLLGAVAGLGSLVVLGESQALDQAALTGITYCALLGMCYSVLGLAARRWLPALPLFPSNLLLLLTGVGTLALVYHPLVFLPPGEFMVAWTRTLCAPYVLHWFAEHGDYLIATRTGGTTMAELVFTREGIVFLVLALAHLWSASKESAE